VTGEFDLDLINKAPIDLTKSEGGQAELKLRNEKAILQDEIDRLKKEKSIESQKGRLIIPYVKNVFRFCCGYTTVSVTSRWLVPIRKPPIFWFARFPIILANRCSASTNR